MHVSWKSYDWLKPVEELPLQNGAGGQIHQAIEDAASGRDGHHISHAHRPGSRPIGKPCRHFGLPRLVKGNDIEEEGIAVSFLDDVDGRLDLSL